MTARVVEVVSRDAVEAVVRRDPVLHALELGDLDDFFWPHTHWFALERKGEIEALVLLYVEPDPPVLIAMCDEPDAAMEELLAAILGRLPGRVYVHTGVAGLGVLSRRYDVEPGGPHLRMGLERTDLLGVGLGEPEWLAPADLTEVESFYRAAYPGTWFAPRMLETGRYLGIRASGRLVAVAGVHVWSPRYRVAVLGNVAVLPDARGSGLATTACAFLCRTLLADGIKTIALNVHADNATAIRVYEKLGFVPRVEFEEAMLTERLL